MANGGWYGTKEEWARLESPLIEVDPIIHSFAAEFGLEVTKNYKDEPERSIIWGGGIRRLIQLYLVDKKQLTFNLWLCASQDRNGSRYWKQESPVKAQTISSFKDSLPMILRDSRSLLESWGENDLELATKVGWFS
jgi:hypothetical protein